MTSFKNRIIRAAMLDVNLYEEVEADKAQCAKPWELLFFPVSQRESEALK